MVGKEEAWPAVEVMGICRRSESVLPTTSLSPSPWLTRYTEFELGMKATVKKGRERRARMSIRNGPGDEASGANKPIKVEQVHTCITHYMQVVGSCTWEESVCV